MRCQSCLPTDGYNEPGCDIAPAALPLYSAGARVRAIYPIGPLMMGMGLNFTVMSYIDSVDFGLQCDPMLLPDPWVISDRVPDALAELTKTGKSGRAAGRRQ